VSEILQKYTTYLIHSILIGSPSLVTKIITLEDIAREKTRSSLDNIGSHIFLGEGHFPGIMAAINVSKRINASIGEKEWYCNAQVVGVVVPGSVGNIQAVESVEPRSQEGFSLGNTHVGGDEGFHAEIVVSITGICGTNFHRRGSNVVVTVSAGINK
jgi:hypothetical protein